MVRNTCESNEHLTATPADRPPPRLNSFNTITCFHIRFAFYLGLKLNLPGNSETRPHTVAYAWSCLERLKPAKTLLVAIDRLPRLLSNFF
ncbi:hypothetical protein E2C01_043588 [Portunus trituberculatus]|uniref:Uncharacterized protein n=1 Tax=Portunus trituberculatus TaxID=210409 RepID=A0A5B7FZZ4_PORTR|nr:hypothetical protein [Portunus trituberculatus]